MFEQDTYSGTEGGSPVIICAEITAVMGTLDCEVVVTFSDLPGAKTGRMMAIHVYSHKVIEMQYKVLPHSTSPNLVPFQMWRPYCTQWCITRMVALQLTTCCHSVVQKKILSFAKASCCSSL